MARGDAEQDIPALETTKWFDTNYHYLVPELSAGQPPRPFPHPVLADARLVREL